MLGKKRNPDTTRAMKALSLYSLLLFSGKRYSLTELAALLDCSKPTVIATIRDIESTRGLHAPVMTERIGGPRYYWCMRPEKKPNTSLAASAIQDLTLCRDLLAHVLPPALRDEIDTTITQTTVLLQDYDEREAALRPLPIATTTGAVDYSKHQDTLATVLDGLRQHHILEIHYQAHDRAEAKTLAIAPLNLITHRDALYLKGRREQDLGKKTGFYDPILAIHRMQSATSTDRAFKPPKTNKADAYSVFGFMPGKPFKVTIEAEPRVAPYLKERIWSHDQQFTDLDAGRVRLKFSATSEEEVVSWILGFAGQVVLREPLGLRGRLRECVRELSKL